MSHPRQLLHPVLCLFLWTTTCHATEPDPQEIDRLSRKLSAIRDVYAGERFERLTKTYGTMLRDRDVATWKAAVAQDGQRKHRTSFLAEVFAYSGDFEVAPVQLRIANSVLQWPLTTRKKRLQLFAFQPHKSKTDEPLSDKFKETTYIIIRGKVPLENNPYGVVLCQALRGYTRLEIQRIVEAYQKSW